MTNRERILIVDDDRARAGTLARTLERAGHPTQTADHGRAALAALDREPCDLVLTDQKLPDLDGTEMVRQVRARRPDLPVMVLTAAGSFEGALAAVREGAVDFIQKPVFAEELLHRIDRVFRMRRTDTENAALKSRIAHHERGDAMVGTSPAMDRLRARIQVVAGADAPVLIRGEPGSGRKLVADAIHFASHRESRPLRRIHCGAYPEPLLQAELFGHERGAFPGADHARPGALERADGGTLLLEEPESLPPALQRALVSYLREGTIRRVGANDALRVDVRLIASTSDDLQRLAQSSVFDAELAEHLGAAVVDVPPLREREDDVILLARYFARDAGTRNNRPIEKISADAIDRLRKHNWPGNVAELQHAVERAVLMGGGPLLDGTQFRFRRKPGAIGGNGHGHGPENGTLVARLLNSEIAFDDFEKEILVRALQRTRGNQTRAARLLGMTRRTLQYRIDKFDIDCEPMRR